jgi:hypothetical protein
MEMKEEKANDNKSIRWVASIVLFVAIIMIFATFMPLAMAGKPNPPPTTTFFNTSTIDSKGWVGDYNRIATDLNGHAHITYYDYSLHALKYATNAAGSWAIETLAVVGSRTDNPRGGVADILVDSNNVVHIVYINANHNLVYAKKISGAWTSQFIFPGREVSGQISLAMDGSGNLHFSYNDVTAQETLSLRYASCNNGIWTNEVVFADPDLVRTSSLAVGPDGIAHIVYTIWFESKLRYATSADSWQVHIVDPDNFVGYNANIVVDTEGIIYIAYSAWTANPNLPNPAYLNAKYAHGSIDDWDYHMVDDTRCYGDQWTLIAVDGGGVVHIVYNVYTDNVGTSSVKYVTFTDDTMSVIRTVEGSSGSGYYLDMAVDSQTQPKVHISFVNDAKWDLKYAISK